MMRMKFILRNRLKIWIIIDRLKWIKTQTKYSIGHVRLDHRIDHRIWMSIVVGNIVVVDNRVIIGSNRVIIGSNRINSMIHLKSFL